MTLNQLATVLEPGTISFDDETRRRFAGDKWSRGPLPDAVARPRTVEEVSRLLQWANANQTPVTTRGGGYGYVGGAVTNRGGVLLSLDRMNTIREISTADFVAEVEAGVVTGDLQQAARAQGLFIRPTRRRWPFPLSAATSRPMRWPTVPEIWCHAPLRARTRSCAG
jgi:glycolate oxidase